MDGVERVMVLGIFIVIVLILGVLAWDASSDEDPTAVLAPGADGGSGVSAAALSDDNAEGRASNPRGEMAQGPSLTDSLLERRRRDGLAGRDASRGGIGQPAQRPEAGEQVAQAKTNEVPQLGSSTDPLSAPRSDVLSLSSSTSVHSAKPEPRTHVVQAGETAWRIATKHYGTGDMNAILDMIQDANPGLDLEQLGLGQVITLPAKVPASAVLPAPQERAAAGEGQLYKVVAGDTLHGIAQDHYNDARRWKDIYDLNRHLIASPSDLSVGVSLLLPEK